MSDKDLSDGTNNYWNVEQRSTGLQRQKAGCVLRRLSVAVAVVKPIVEEVEEHEHEA